MDTTTTLEKTYSLMSNSDMLPDKQKTEVLNQLMDLFLDYTSKLNSKLDGFKFDNTRYDLNNL